MSNLPDILRKYTTQLWYILFSTVFFFVFMVAYQPFGTKEAFDMGRNLQIVNVAILTSIVLVALFILRSLFYFLNKYLCKNWWQYIGWILLGFLSLGIGFLWISPWMEMAHIRFYEELKQGNTMA